MGDHTADTVLLGHEESAHPCSLDESSSEFDEEEEEHRPYKLRDIGNQLFKDGKYHEANQTWLQSVKESLKRSVRYPSAKLYQNQLICRLNLSMGYLKLGEWVEAKEQASLVLEQSPHNVKALYRLAQALENLQDWTPCETALQGLINEVQRYREWHHPPTDHHVQAPLPEEKKTLSDTADHDTMKDDGTSEDNEPSQQPPDLAGFTPEEIEKLVAQMRHRIAVARNVYHKKSKQMFQGIGKKLAELGVSENRYCSEDVGETAKRDPLGLPDLTPEDMAKELVGTDMARLVQWRYKMSTDELAEYEAAASTEKAKHESDDATNAGKVLGSSVTPVLRDGTEGSPSSDDPTAELWTRPHTVATLKTDRRPLTLSLPFTLLHIIERAISMRKVSVDDRHGDAVSMGQPLSSPDDDTRSSTRSTIFSEQEAHDVSSAGLLRRNLLWALCRRKELTVHVVGARGDSEMESQWTAVLRRLPTLKTLTIFFIGFLDSDDRWSKSLREGILTPPLVKRQGLLPGQKLSCRLYKGMYQTFVNEHPGVLSSTRHPFHPTLVMIPEPRLSLFFDTWVPVFQCLIHHHIPMVLTGYSAKDFASHEASNLPPVIQKLSGEWTIPLHANPYALQVSPEPECGPMELWAPSGEQRVHYRGISAKHGVVGCVLSPSTSTTSTDDTVTWMSQDAVEDLKATLRGVCDVEEEALAQRDAYEQRQAQAEDHDVLLLPPPSSSVPLLSTDHPPHTLDDGTSAPVKKERLD